eukprot:7089432-Pyramimonas_sp.AAC.1
MHTYLSLRQQRGQEAVRKGSGGGQEGVQRGSTRLKVKNTGGIFKVRCSAHEGHERPKRSGCRGGPERVQRGPRGDLSIKFRRP